MKSNNSRIPVCKSDYLQNVMIEIGRNSKTLRYAARLKGIEFKASFDEFDGQTQERIDIQVFREQNSFINIVLWENCRAMYVKRPARYKHEIVKDVKIIADIRRLNFYEIADLVGESIRDSDGIQKIWLQLAQQNDV